MSGGSFDYLCHRDVLEAVGRSEYRYMIEELEGIEHSAAAEIAEKMKGVLIEAANLQSEWDRITPVLRAVEWWRSSDWSRDQVIEALDRHSAGL